MIAGPCHEIGQHTGPGKRAEIGEGFGVELKVDATLSVNLLSQEEKENGASAEHGN